MNTSQINAALRGRYCSPEWAIMFEVGNATGARQRRWADAVAMNLYPSRGLEIHGFEVKISRSDWTRELKNPDKSAPVQEYCDRWWIVAPPGVVKEGELPPTWGLIEAKNGKLMQVVAAPKLDAKPVSKSFVAAMLRRASELDEGEVRAAVAAEVEKQREGDKKYIEQQIDFRTRRAKELEEAVAKIEEVSGIKIARWGDNEELGRAIKMVMDSGAFAAYRGLAGLQRDLANMSKQLTDAVTAFNALALAPQDAA